jgi:hypothetical protein
MSWNVRTCPSTPAARSAAWKASWYHFASSFDPRSGWQKTKSSSERYDEPAKCAASLVDEGSGERDRALPFLRLRLLDAERSLDEVHVPPAQGEELRAAQAGQGEGQEHPAPPIV